MPDNKIITDREELLEAFRNTGLARQYADDTLKAGGGIVRAAGAEGAWIIHGSACR